MSLTALLDAARACRVCEPHLPEGPRPVLQMAPTARLLIVGQAPGSKVHRTGIAWNDASGERLRDWTQLPPDMFYDPARIALMPIGFCYPGKTGHGDKPPRPECAPLWHARLLAALPDLRLVLLVGSHAQRHYLEHSRKATMTETVRGFSEYAPRFLPLPHPSWRSTIWMRKNPWFEEEVLPALRAVVREALR